MPMIDVNIQRKISAQFLFMVVLCVLVSLALYFIHFKSTALTWPAVDNLFAVCRLIDSTCLETDFFTNASSSLNPRLPFINIIYGLTNLADNGIGGGLALAKSFLIIMLPSVILVFFFLTIFNDHKIHSLNLSFQNNPALFCVGLLSSLIVLLLQSQVGDFLSIAWWKPLYFDSTPQNFSIFFGLLGMCLLVCDKYWLSCVFIFISGMIHPAVNIFVMTFSLIIHLDFSKLCSSFNIKLLKYAFLPTILAALVVSYWFNPGETITSSQFIDVYVHEATPSHYVPSQFGTLTRFSWYTSFALVCTALLTIAVFLYRQKSPYWLNALIAGVSYGSCVLIQYVAVEVYPIKFFAALGPSRFSLFGAWFIGFFLMLLILKPLLVLCNMPKVRYLIEMIFKSMRPLYVFLLGFFLFFIFVLYGRDSNNFDFLKNEDIQLIHKVASITNVEDVIVLPFGDLRVYLPLMTRRSVFFGNGFPFSEQYFSEYKMRKSLIDGDREAIEKLSGSWIGEKYMNFYRALTPEEFYNISYAFRADWLVIETQFSIAFQNCDATWTGSHYKIYQVRQLRKCI